MLQLPYITWLLEENSFLIDYTNSLALASTFASFKNYKLIFLTGSDTKKIPKENLQGLVEQEGFGFLKFKTPGNYEEAQAAIIGLESVVWELSEKLPLHLYKQYKPEVEGFNQIKVPNFPRYFSHNAALWNFIVKKEKNKLNGSIQNAAENLETLLKNPLKDSITSHLEMFDIISFFMQISLFYSCNQTMADFINKMSISEVTKLVIALRRIIAHTTKAHSLNAYEETIIKACLSPFRYFSSFIYFHILNIF